MTPTLEQLTALLERAQKATGPEARLDAEIACALVFTDKRPAEPDDFDGKYGYSPRNIKCEHGFLMAEAYTTSIDSALALVERVLPGATWSHDMDQEGRDGSHMISIAWRSDDHSDWVCEDARAATVPLAILATTLTALIAQAKERGE